MLPITSNNLVNRATRTLVPAVASSKMRLMHTWTKVVLSRPNLYTSPINLPRTEVRIFICAYELCFKILVRSQYYQSSLIRTSCSSLSPSFFERLDHLGGAFVPSAQDSKQLQVGLSLDQRGDAFHRIRQGEKLLAELGITRDVRLSAAVRHLEEQLCSIHTYNAQDNTHAIHYIVSLPLRKLS